MYSPVFNGILEKGISRTLTYDTDYLLTDIVDSDGSSTSPLDWYYAYDTNANIELIRDDLDGGNRQDFFYDKLNRLETAAGSYGDIAYSYDNVGNRLTKLHTDGGVTRKETYTYSYQTGLPDSHQLETIAVDLTNDGVDDESRNFAYDDNGNLVVDDQATNPDFDLTYNSHQRYEQLDIGGAPTTYYQHNSLGQRVQKTTMQTIHYHYDESGRLIGETDQLGNSKEYIYADDKRVARYDNAIGYYFHNDHLGRPIALTDQSKAVVWQAEYLPFGQVYVLNNNTIDNELGFPGQILDQESGFYYNYFRDYDPTTGKYIQADPLGLDGGDLNIYRYALSNPVNLIDSFGLFFQQPGSGSGSSDFTLPDFPDSDRDRIQPILYHCRITFTVKSGDECDQCPSSVSGNGSGPTPGTAKAAARRAARLNLPPQHNCTLTVARGHCNIAI